MTTRSITISYEARSRVFVTLVAVSILSLGVYTYAVLATVYHTVARESLVGERSSLSMSVSELEYKDIALRNTINLDTALTRGFREVTSPLYVTRGSDTLTLNTANR